MEIGRTKISDAITFAVAAGGLRIASRHHGGLRGLDTLADAMSERAKACSENFGEETLATVGPSPAGRLEIRTGKPA